MMGGDLRAARRYAGALFELARERNELDEVATGLREVAQVATNSRELMNVLRHPRITPARKKELLHKVFGAPAPHQGTVETGESDVGAFSF